MFKYLFAFVLFFVLQNVQAQITWDTTGSGTRSSRHDEGINGTFKPSIKASVFYNESVGFEIGRVKQYLDLGTYLSGTTSTYYAVGHTANKN
jgi:hypothetical protein